MHGGESGQATLELALVLPALLVVLLGAVQLALVQHAGSVADTAAAEGARLAASEGGSLLEGAERTREVLRAGLGTSGSGFSVRAEHRGEVVATEASGRYRLFIPWVRDLHVRIESRSEVRREGLRGGP
ncbi:MAG: pilus assembly protein [Chloroflexi bacterium]|nr:pilus assembly protein [Chloroflexota bacterium]